MAKGDETKDTPRKRTPAPATQSSGKTSSTSKAKSPSGVFLSGGIDTPKGVYTPQSDNLMEELKAAARFAGLTKFRIHINGKQILETKDVPKTISGLAEVARVEGVDASASVQRYDKAG